MPKIFFIPLVLIFSISAIAQEAKWKAMEVEADTLLQRDDFSGALVLYNQIVSKSKSKYSNLNSLLQKRAYCLYREGEYELSLTDLDNVLAKDPDQLQSRLLRAYIYRDLGDLDGQFSDINIILEQRPGSPEMIRWRASIYLDKGEYESALTDLKEIKPYLDDVETSTYLAFAYFNLDRPDSALLQINSAIEKDPTFIPAYMYASSFCLQEDEYEIALDYIRLALRIDPQNLTALFYKGVALIELEKIDEGCSCLSKAFYGGFDDAGDYLVESCYDKEN